MTEDRIKGAAYLVYEVERRAYPLSESTFTIGRDASSGIVIREPAVSRLHAEVKPEGEGFVLNATGATGTKLDKVLKREIEIDGQAYIAAISPEGVKVTKKGFRKGNEITWRAIISGDANLSEDLSASVDATAAPE